MSHVYEHIIMSADDAERWENDENAFICTRIERIFDNTPSCCWPRICTPYTKDEVRSLLIGTEAEDEWGKHGELFGSFAEWVQKYGFYQYEHWRNRKGVCFERIIYLTKKSEQVVIYFAIES